MTPLIVETQFKNGQVELRNLPFADNTDVTVIIIPKVNWDKLAFHKARELSRSIKGSLAADIMVERGVR